MTECVRKAAEVCKFCGAAPGEICPLDEPVFSGPAIGATVAVGVCVLGEACEACE